MSEESIKRTKRKVSVSEESVREEGRLIEPKEIAMRLNHVFSDGRRVDVALLHKNNGVMLRYLSRDGMVTNLALSAEAAEATASLLGQLIVHQTVTHLFAERCGEWMEVKGENTDDNR